MHRRCIVGVDDDAKVYAARAEIIFQPLQEGDISEGYKATQTVLVSGQAVLGATAQTLRIPIEDLSASFSVGFPKGGSVMQLQFADPDPDAAINTLNLVLDRYLLTLGGLDVVDQATHRLLVPPFLLNGAIQSRPLQAAVIGFVIGLAISLAAFALVRRARAGR